MDSKVPSFVEGVKEFMALRKENHRFCSWEHCYKAFSVARESDNPDYDRLSLQLAFYLASWGMYRGSSFLLQYDYKVHEPVVKRILAPDCDFLLNLDCYDSDIDYIWTTLEDLGSFMDKEYGKLRSQFNQARGKGPKGDNESSDILKSKILLGTLGCVPAYDRFFTLGIKKGQHLGNGSYGKNSYVELVTFYKKNYGKYERIRKEINKQCGVEYTQMKLLDMGFWQIGKYIFDDEKEKKKDIKQQQIQ